nr:ubiquitin carboxyl terminal hydrolase 7 [Hymenolepis microstoma]
MQIEEDQAFAAGQKHKIGTPPPDGRPPEFIPVDDDSLSEVNIAKRRKLSDASEKGASLNAQLNVPNANSYVLTENSDIDGEEENLTSFDEAGPTGILEFRVSKFSDLLKHNKNEDIRLVSSNAAIIRCLPWRVLVIFRFCDEESRTVGFFLQCNAESESISWSCHARADLTIVSQKPGGESVTKTIDHTFSHKENDWGFSNFINWTDFTDPERGLVCMEVENGSPQPNGEKMETSEDGISRVRSSSLSESPSNGQMGVKTRVRFLSHPSSPKKVDQPPQTPDVIPEPDSVLFRIKIYADAPHGSNWDSKRFTGFVGLRNQGATCYMNSLLQALFFTNELRRAVYLMPTESEEPATSIPLALQRLFFELQFNERPVNTKRLTRSFGWQSVESLFQHDVQELCRLLLDNMETKMKGTSVEGTIPSLFRGKMLSYIRCKHVPYESKMEETFYDIQLKVKGNQDVYQAFKEYTTVETLEGDNKYAAGEHGLQEAEKGVIFTHFPPVLYLQLMRFQYDCFANANIKLNDRFEFPYRLKLDGFLKEPDPTNPATYVLHAVLVHSGDNHSGHYVVYINPSGNDQWYKFDDDVVSRSTQEEAIEHNFGTITDKQGNVYRSYSNAYMLVYIRESCLGRVLRPIALDDIPECLVSRLREEKRIEADHRKARAELSNSTTLLLVLDEDFYGWQGSDLCNFETIPSRRFHIPKNATYPEILGHVASILRIDSSYIRLWRLMPRISGSVRFSPLLPSRPHIPKSPITAPSSDHPIRALSALTDAYQPHRSPTKTAVTDPHSGSGDRKNNQVPVPFANDNAAPVWVQILPRPLHTQFSPFTEVLCFLKYFSPPLRGLTTTSPLLESIYLGTMVYVGWIIIPLSIPLSTIFSELCSRAALPSNTPLELFVETYDKDVRPISGETMDSLVEEALGIHDGLESVILVYQQQEEEIEEKNSVEEVNSKMTNSPASPEAVKSPVKSPTRSQSTAAQKLISRSKQLLRNQSPSSTLSMSVSEESCALPSRDYNIVNFYHGIRNGILVEFYTIYFPWYLLNGLTSSEPAAVISFPMKTGDRILLPGVPHVNNVRTVKAGFLLEHALPSINSPDLICRVPLDRSFQDVVKIAASHLSVSPSNVQIFIVSSSLPAVSGEREFSAIHSHCQWTVRDFWTSQHGLAPNHRQQRVPNLHFFCQSLPIPTQKMEQMCQLRCIFVDARKMREMTRLLLIVPKTWTVSQLVELARKELISIDILPEGDTSCLRMFETLNSWIIQQFAPEETAGRLQLLENRMLRIEAMTAEEQGYFAYIDSIADPEELCSQNHRVEECKESPDGSSSPDIGPKLPSSSFPQGLITTPGVLSNSDLYQPPLLLSASSVLGPNLPPSGITTATTTTTTNSSSAIGSSTSSSLSVVTPSIGNHEGEEDDYDDVNIGGSDDNDDDDDIEIEDDIEIPRSGNFPSNADATSSEGDSSSCCSPAEPNNLSLICNADEEVEDEEDNALQFLERESVEENDVQSGGAGRLAGSRTSSSRSSIGRGDDDSMDSCEANKENPSSSSMDASYHNSRASEDSGSDVDDQKDNVDVEDASSGNVDNTSKLPVVCSLFYKDSANGAITIGLMPFTIVLRQGERVSSLLKRIRNHLNIRADMAEKWRLTILKGPIFPSSAGVSPLTPTQESLAFMRVSTKHIPMTTGENGGKVEARIDLTNFMPAPDLVIHGLRKSRLLFGLRPWLGIEMPLLARKGPAVFSNFQNNPASVDVAAAAKRKNLSGVTRYLPSEKPIRIFN